MTQENLSASDDRSRPRYQVPSTSPTRSSGSASSTGENGQGFAANPGVIYNQPVPNSVRPTDWPAPEPGSGAFPAPPVAPIVPGAYDWNKATAGPRSDNLYRYENYNSTPLSSTSFTPPQSLDPQAEVYRQASRRVRARLDFQKNLWSYLLVNGFLWVIYFMTLNPAHQTFWPIWSTVFWGIGVLAQWRNLSGRQDDRQRRMVEEEMRRRNHY